MRLLFVDYSGILAENPPAGTMDPHRLRLEKRLWSCGIGHIGGVDEVGRGSVAGPVVAGAAVFDRFYYLPQVTDSKLITAKMRKDLAETLRQSALSWAIGYASVQEIDMYNIRQATFIAMRRAVYNLGVNPDYLIVDGEQLPDPPCRNRGVIRGDQKSFTIAAASIIAKVERDAYMTELDYLFPRFLFESNKGYATQDHINAIKEFGLTPHHRRSFVGRILNYVKAGETIPLDL